MSHERGTHKVDGSAAAALRSIVEKLNAGQSDLALAASRQHLAMAPDDPALNALAAIAAHRCAHHVDAIAYARRSLALRPDHVETQIVLGRAARALGSFGEASEAFARAVALAPRRAEATFLLCATRLQGGDAGAVAMLDPMLAQFPDDAAGWEEIGIVLQTLGKKDAALVCLRRAARRAADVAQAMRIGERMREGGSSAEASVAFARAVALDPMSARAWFHLGLALQDSGITGEACAAYRKALEIEPGLAEAALNLGTVLQEGGDLEGAKTAYGRAVAIRADTFGRVAQALTTPAKGELWLDLRRLRKALVH